MEFLWGGFQSQQTLIVADISHAGFLRGTHINHTTSISVAWCDMWLSSWGPGNIFLQCSHDAHSAGGCGWVFFHHPQVNLRCFKPHLLFDANNYPHSSMWGYVCICMCYYLKCMYIFLKRGIGKKRSVLPVCSFDAFHH